MNDMDDKINETDIREFKLTSGESLIAEMVGTYEGMIILMEPYCLTHNASGVAIFRRWFYTCRQPSYYLPESHVISTSKCWINAKKQYINAILEDRTLDEIEDNEEQYDFYSEPEESDVYH